MIVSGVRFVAGRNDYADRDGTKYGIAIHNTSNTASADSEASYATRRTDGISSHFYCDDTEVIQSIDTKYRAGHAGSYEGNEHAVAVEITGTNDKSRAWWIANVAWDKLGAALAQVCRAYDIEPRRASVAEMQRNPKVRAFYSHNDMRQAWGGTTHTDPGPNFPWDYLFAAVKAHLSPTTPAQEDDMTPGESWVLHVMNYRLEAIRANRAVIKVPARTDLGAGYTAFEEPNLLAVALGAEGTNPAELSAALAGLPKPTPVDVNALASALAPKLVTSLPADSPVTDEQLERVLRSVLGSLNDTAPQG